MKAHRIFFHFIASLCLLLQLCGQASAAVFVKANVTTLLGPTFFFDDAVAGGTDTTVTQPSVGTFTRTFGGLLTANQGSTEVRITGFGFAGSSASASNTATSLRVAFTYLGANAAVGGGDDVVIGSVTGTYVYASGGEYSCIFDAPLVATLNITTGLKFQIAVTPTNGTANGSVQFKVGTIFYDGGTGARMSVAGTVSTGLTAVAPRVNLAKYQPTTASTTNGQYRADFATDGVVGNTNRWVSTNVNTAHWLEVDMPVPVTVRSAQVHTGFDDGSVLASFKVQYWSSSAWVDAPGASVAGITVPQVNVIFTSAVTSDRFRLYTDDNGTIRVKEFALFPPNPAPGTGTEQGYPLGTDVELNLARERPAVASSVSTTNYAKLAVDGYLSSASKWQTTTVGAATLDIDLRLATKIASAHLYSGDGSVAPISSFNLQSWDGTAWVAIPGGTITGNTSGALVITFSSAVTTSMVRLSFTNAATSAVRELCVFPANGGVAYPIGQEVLATAPPTRKFDDYNNAFYNVQNRAASLPISINGTTPVLNLSTLDPLLSHYQLLLNIGTDTYRLRNRSTGRCLAGAGVSLTTGATLVDEDYSAMPHQNWQIITVDSTDFYLRNEWSGLVIDTQSSGITAGTTLVQQSMNGTTTQHWRPVLQTHFPKKGMAGYFANAAAIKGNWGYNWGRTTSVALPPDAVFHPMQWGNGNWDIGSTQGPLEQFLSEWKRQDHATHLLGFNEPDGATQSNIIEATALTLWPRLERMEMPLVSPVTVNPDNAWMNTFMTQAQTLGYRVDAVAAHNYPSPNGGSSDALVTLLQTLNTDWNRPVWLTEFSTVDWAGTASWTEEDNYNWLAEFMWRAESLTWLRHYSLFLFTADATYPEPTNVTDTVAPRSNAYKADGVTPTSFGELYFAWDGDATVRGDKPYFIHNKSERKRIQNAVSSTAPGNRFIRDGSNVVQWVLRPSGTAGQWHIVSLRDGRLLRYTGTALNFAPAHTTGTAVRWSLVADQYGWNYLENPAAVAANRRLKFDNGVFSMVANTSTVDQNKWRFIVPYAPVEAAAPVTPTNLASTAGDAQVALTWTASSSSDMSFYSVYRSTSASGPFTLVASNLATASYTNTALQNGTSYYYTVTATDLTGYESVVSTQSSAMPVIATLPTSFAATSTSGNFTITWPATHLGWILEQTDTLTTNTWTPVPNSTATTSHAMPLPPGTPRMFFRLRRP